MVERAARAFGKRLLLFVGPFIAVAALAVLALISTGEMIPVRFVAWLQTFNRPFVFLPKFSDHTYKLKQEAIRLRRPQILVLGSSRANQWRSGMFRPEEFYNGGNAIFLQRDFARILEEFGDYAPRVIIFSIDYFTFTDAWEETYKSQSRSDIGWPWSPEFIKILSGLMSELVTDPKSLVPLRTDGIYEAYALGLYAAQTGTGARIDGSYQYGHAIRGFPQITVQSAVEAIHLGRQWPVLPGSNLGERQRQELQRFATLAKAKGITLIGITMPFAPELARALDESSRHEVWKNFQSDETRQWLQDLGILYFDFTRLDSFGGKSDEFVDPFHPSEPAYIRMLLTMLRNPMFRSVFPKMNADDLKSRLRESSRLEAFRNEF
jgi:hypothetical protein